LRRFAVNYRLLIPALLAMVLGTEAAAQAEAPFPNKTDR